MDEDYIYPASFEDAQFDMPDPVYRGVAPQSDTLFPTMNNVFESKFSFESDEIMLSSFQPCDIISTGAIRSEGRSGAFSPTQFPIYDCHDIMPLEKTHINFHGQEEQKESLFIGVINRYLADHDEQITFTTTEDSILNTENNPGFYKCSTGVMNDDFSYDANYCSFAIQIYSDLSDSSNMIIEFQRRRGSHRTFNLLFQHFKSVADEYIIQVKEQGLAPDTTIVNTALCKQFSMTPNDKIVTNISPTGPSDMFDLIS